MKPREINIYDLGIIRKARETGKNLDGVIRKLEDGFVVFTSFDEWKPDFPVGNGIAHRDPIEK